MTTICVVFVRHGTRIKLISILPAYRQTVDKGSMHQRSIVRDDSDLRLPGAARMALEELVEQIETVTARIERLDRKILEAIRKDDNARRLTAIPGVGPIIAATVRAVVPDPAGLKPVGTLLPGLG